MPRLTKIYTRTGDDGTTGLAGVERVRKDSARIEAMGDIDELNSLIGLIRSLPGEAQGIDEMLESIQHRLFDIGGELAMPSYEFAKPEWTERLENWLDQLNADLPTLKEFILPGGSHRGAACHQARAVSLMKPIPDRKYRDLSRRSARVPRCPAESVPNR